MKAGTLRPRPGEDAAAWTRAVFAAGDYAGVAMYGDPATGEYHAARALILGDRASFAALADYHGAEAQLHRGAALWIHGDTAGARRELVGCASEQAQNLLRRIDQPRIRVLCQLPWQADVPTDLLRAAQHDRHFELRNVGNCAGDVQNTPYADVGRFLDEGFRPDFYLAAMVEWHHLPPNLQALPCPRFGHLADHDLHIQTIEPWLHLFDELCVTDRTEWLDVQGLGRGPVTSFPKCFGLPGNLPPLPTGERHLDFFVSGTMLDPYHPDKARLLHELLSMQDIDLRVVRGFAGTMAFYALLAASKMSFTYVRRPGAMPTRGLESLAMGCAVALQEESVLNLFVGRDEGVATYGPRTGALSACVRRILDDWRHYGPAALRGAAAVRAQFALPRMASQYLRFLTFRAAAPRAVRQPLDTSTWCQKRVCVTKTWLPDSPVVRRRSMQANFRRLGQVLARNPQPAVLVDMARELVAEFAYYHDKRQAAAEDRSLLDDAIGLLEKGLRLFPDHLVLRFVYVRIVLHYGEPAARARALQLAYDAVERPPEAFAVDVACDVLPFDFHSEFFNYRDYLDLVARTAKGDAVPPVAFARLLLASLAGYVARKTSKPALHELAAGLDPAFARYQLDWAKALLTRGEPADRGMAQQLLATLAAGSTEFPEAARLLQQHRGERVADGPERALLRALRRMEEDTIDASVSTVALFRTERRAAAAARGGDPVAAPAGPATPVAVLVPEAGTERELAGLLTDLEAQTHAASLEVVVMLGPDDAAAQRLLAQWPTSAIQLKTVAVPSGATMAARLNAGVAASVAPLLGLALPGDRFRADTFALLCEELDQHEAAAVAFGNEGWTDRDVARFDPSACTALSCPPPFGAWRLLSTDAIGGHPVWRRSLHERCGGFDARYGAAAEYEFWLRALVDGRVRQLPTLLSASRLDAGWRARRLACADPAAALRARAAHAGAGSLPPFVAQRPLPSVLFAPGLLEEATSHARLGLCTQEEQREIGMLAHFYGTALLHGDHGTALCLLRAAAANLPRLLSARLAQASLLEALGWPGAREVLESAVGAEPYREIVARRLAALAPRPPVEPVACDPNLTPREVVTCPT